MDEHGIMRVTRLQPPPARSAGSTWMVGAGVLLLVSGALNMFYGFSAIYNDDYVAEEEFLFGPVTMWGWLAVGIAVVMFATAIGLFARSGMAALFGILIASVSALAHLLAIGANTWWSILVIVVDVAIVFGLSRHGFEAQ
jgi:hypothetical protein